MAKSSVSMACSITEIALPALGSGPLLVVYRGVAPQGRQVEQPVTLRDVAATLADLAGLPAGVVPGASLARFWRQSPSVEPRTQSPVMSEVSKGIRTPPWYPVSRGDMRSLVERGQALHPWWGRDGAAFRPDG
jgi:hypothetical protein